MFVGGFNLTNPRLFGSDLVDDPSGGLFRAHVSLLQVEALKAGGASCERRCRVYRHRPLLVPLLVSI
jgi:hypothetical protein